MDSIVAKTTYPSFIKSLGWKPPDIAKIKTKKCTLLTRFLFRLIRYICLIKQIFSTMLPKPL